MRKRSEEETEAKTLRINEACKRYGLGHNTMRRVAEEAKAVVRVGKCYLVNCTKMDKYMDDLTR